MSITSYEGSIDLSELDVEHELNEQCPKCSADPGEACMLRGRMIIEPHRARREVAVLRYARQWMPDPGERILIGVYPDAGLECLFVRFTERGEVQVDDLGAGWNFSTFDVLSVWPTAEALLK